MKFGLNDDIIEKINSVFEQFPDIPEVFIYGSRAKNTFREDSDIDLLINASANNIMLKKIKNQLENLCIVYEIDIKFYDELIDLKFRRKVESYAKKFYIKK